MAFQLYNLSHRLREPRFAVGGQAHDLVLIRKRLEPEMPGDECIKKTERMRQRDLQYSLEFVAATHVNGGAGIFTAAVDDDDEGLFESGAEERGRCVRKMMIPFAISHLREIAGRKHVAEGVRDFMAADQRPPGVRYRAKGCPLLLERGEAPTKEASPKAREMTPSIVRAGDLIYVDGS